MKFSKIIFVFFVVAYTVMLLFPHSNIKAQPSITWQKLYNGPFPTSSDNGSDMCMATNGNFFVSGRELSPAGQRAFVLKLKPNGDTIWTRYFTNQTSGSSYLTAEAVVSSLDGGCVITGSSDQPYTCKLDSNGNTAWFRKYGPGSVRCMEIIRTNDGGYIACGDQIANVRDGFLLKIDSLGNLQFRKNFKSGFSKIFYSILQSKNTDFILNGTEYDCELCSGNSFVLTLNSYGDSISEKPYTIEIEKMIQVENGYLICGSTPIDSIHPFNQVYIAKLSLGGEVSNFKIIKDDKVEFLKDFKVINENRYVIVTDTDTLGNRIAGVSIIDSMGNVLHRKIFAVTDYSIFFSVLPFENGDIGFTGTVETHLPQRRDVVVIRSDSNLYVKPVGITQNSSIVIQNFKLLQNYPNPFNPSTNLEFRIPEQGFVILKVYDVIGNEVATLVNERKTAGNYTVKWNAANYPSGVYFYKLAVSSSNPLRTASFSETKRMVLLK